MTVRSATMTLRGTVANTGNQGATFNIECVVQVFDAIDVLQYSAVGNVNVALSTGTQTTATITVPLSIVDDNYALRPTLFVDVVAPVTLSNIATLVLPQFVVPSAPVFSAVLSGWTVTVV